MIPENFFEREERDGFTVPPMMKRVWAAELKVLSEVERICDRHGLRCFADYGTLIGAIRHQGFIPWDDDIDLSMPRKDYMTFLSVAEHELPSHYLIHSYFTLEDHKQPFTVVMNRRDYGVDEEVNSEFYNCPFVVGVELYPLDYLPRDPQERETLITLHQAVYDCCTRFYEYQESGELNDRLQKIKSLTGVTFREDQSLVMQVRQLSDRIASLYTEEEADELVLMYDFSLYEHPHIRRKEWFSDRIRKPYEYQTIPVPVGYEEFLRSKYGDYRIPTRNVNNHEYPFYKSQLPELPEELRERLLKGGELE